MAVQTGERFLVRPERVAPYVKSEFTIGVDLGQSVDPSACCVLEKRTPMTVGGHEMKHRPGRPVYHVRDLRRLELGASYTAQAAYVRGLVERVAAIAGATPKVILDWTSIGRPVAELFKHAGLKPELVVITGGLVETRTGEGWSVPKLQLISGVQAKLHAGELKVARELPEAKALAHELQDFRMRYTDAGSATFGARTGRHDDLVLSLSLALWWASRRGGGVTLMPIQVGDAD